jgi:glycosyltransferase involved in cell wall biosynthesis
VKIGLEISSLSYPLSGIQVYIKNFLTAILNVDRENKYLFTAKLMKLKKIEEYKTSPFWFRKYDVFHGFDGFIPHFISAKLRSAVVHDVIPLTEPVFVSESTVKNFEKKIKRLLNRADILIAPSEYTKKALSFFFPSKRIHVIYEAPSKCFARIADESICEFKKRLGLNNFILYVGVLNARKNVNGLINAFNIVRRKFKDLQMVIVSSYSGYGGEKTLELINRGHNQGILFLKNVTEKDLVFFYNSAIIFAFPSFAEGFGLPVLEAMACGTPVVTSNTSALPEVGGDAVEYVDPYDVNDIAMKIIELLDDEKKREKLKEAGVKRASSFSWEKSAMELKSIWSKYLNQ